METLKVTDEIIASFIEGTASKEEVTAVLFAAKHDKRIREYLALAAMDTRAFPMMAKAASGPEDDLCTIRCEQYVLQKFGITVSEDDLVKKASGANWLKEGGTPLFRIGCLCADYGLCVCRQYKASLEDIQAAMIRGDEVIVAIDGGEIDGNQIVEMIEDKYVGQIPDHAIVVLSLENDIVVFNPNHGDTPQYITRERFIDAWRDSCFYLVTVNTTDKVADAYNPVPIELGEVELPESLSELTDAIAENNHVVWSRGRMDAGWTYGPTRDDSLKKDPELLPYSALPDDEKHYEKAAAINALKLIVKLGYRIEKDNPGQ